MDFGVLLKKKKIKKVIFLCTALDTFLERTRIFLNLAQYFLHSLLALYLRNDSGGLNILVIIFNWSCDWCPIQFSREIPCSRIINRITNISLCKFRTHRFSVTLRFISNFLNCLFLINFSLLVTS